MLTRILNLQKRLPSAQSAFLFGPRGTGKTSLCNEYLKTVPHAWSVDLLSLSLCKKLLRRPSLFREEVESRLPPPGQVLTVLVDEIQKLPSLLDEVHSLIETHKGKVQFLLTGSSARKLIRGGANLLAGRAWTLKLHPLTCLEMSLNLEKALRWGTLPAVYLSDGVPDQTLLAYTDTYLKEEILQESIVRKAEPFMQFLDLAAQSNGDPVNHSSLARTIHVSPNTIQVYYDILVDTLVALRLPGWSQSVRKQLMHAPKYYFFDCGVLNALRGELELELRPHTYRTGKLFETFLINEANRLNDYTDSRYRFHYWRTNTGQEVDLILQKSATRPPIAIEIKAADSVTESDLHGLKAFGQEHSAARLVCLCQTSARTTLGKVEIFPWEEGLANIFNQGIPANILT